jgi:hypothetical protein
MLRLDISGDPCREESDLSSCLKKTLHNVGSPKSANTRQHCVSSVYAVANPLSVRRAYADLSA